MASRSNIKLVDGYHNEGTMYIGVVDRRGGMKKPRTTMYLYKFKMDGRAQINLLSSYRYRL